MQIAFGKLKQVVDGNFATLHKYQIKSFFFKLLYWWQIWFWQHHNSFKTLSLLQIKLIFMRQGCYLGCKEQEDKSKLFRNTTDRQLSQYSYCIYIYVHMLSSFLVYWLKHTVRSCDLCTKKSHITVIWWTSLCSRVL